MDSFNRKLLWAVWATGPVHFPRLVKLLDVNPYGLTMALGTLYNRGLVSRVEPGTYDITEAGRAFLGEPCPDPGTYYIRGDFRILFD